MDVRDADAAVAGFRSVAAVAALVGCGAGVAAQGAWIGALPNQAFVCRCQVGDIDRYIPSSAAPS